MKHLEENTAAVSIELYNETVEELEWLGAISCSQSQQRPALLPNKSSDPEHRT
jgi:hypothetical protein